MAWFEDHVDKILTARYKLSAIIIRLNYISCVDSFDTFGIYSFQEYPTPVEITLLGEEYAGFEDLETGEKFLEEHHRDPQPRREGDSASCRPEPLERVFRLPIVPGTYRFFRLVKA